ncbi:uncharacterized protein H6S33_010022 [Morchella sextelata]|uniref:uncharacterized protein n=1 Tax=Morchella sextelata TaxID=1174677 RepID=UPI001D03C34A|nr:uncharacterized protein H6S33_010022 [Morchella sextelata]KAH0611970.1 hypothetical protein H6S33_010022 [Morchella sextelata]
MGGGGGTATTSLRTLEGHARHNTTQGLKAALASKAVAGYSDEGMESFISIFQRNEFGDKDEERRDISQLTFSREGTIPVDQSTCMYSMDFRCLLQLHAPLINLKQGLLTPLESAARTEASPVSPGPSLDSTYPTYVNINTVDQKQYYQDIVVIKAGCEALKIIPSPKFLFD